MRWTIVLLLAALSALVYFTASIDAINHHHGEVIDDDNDFAEFEDFDDGKDIWFCCW